MAKDLGLLVSSDPIKIFTPCFGQTLGPRTTSTQGPQLLFSNSPTEAAKPNSEGEEKHSWTVGSRWRRMGMMRRMGIMRNKEEDGNNEEGF